MTSEGPPSRCSPRSAPRSISELQSRLDEKAAVFGALALAGCSLLTDLDGFTPPSGAPDGGGREGGTTPPPLGGAEAGADALAPGDGSAMDAGPQALCAGKHVFCTNFDDAELLARWDTVSPGKGGIVRDGEASTSAPYSLLVTHPKTNLGDVPWVTKTVPLAAPKGLRCRFKYRRAEVDHDGVLVLFMIDFNTDTQEHFFAEVKDGFTEGRVYLNAKTADGTEHDDFPVIPTVSTALHDWADVDWTLDFAPGAPKSTLKRDGDLVDERRMPDFDPARVTSVKLWLGLGDFTEPTSTWIVRYDDLVCDAL